MATPMCCRSVKSREKLAQRHKTILTTPSHTDTHIPIRIRGHMPPSFTILDLSHFIGTLSLLTDKFFAAWIPTGPTSFLPDWGWWLWKDAHSQPAFGQVPGGREDCACYGVIGGGRFAAGGGSTAHSRFKLRFPPHDTMKCR